MSSRIIRIARAADRPAIDAIYAHYVRTSTCTYAETPDSDDVRRAWFEAHGPSHPVTVMEDGDVILGWGSLSPWNPRSAYRHSVESSVYLRPESCGHGFGREIVADLLSRAEALGYHTILAGISADQVPSIGLHERLGFTQVAHLREVGFKFERWLDVVYYQRTLGPAKA